MSSNNNVKALKSGVWYTASNFLTKGVIFLTTPFFTRLLTHEEFGIFNNYISWLGLVTIFVTLNLDASIISAKYDYHKEFDSYIFSLLALSASNAIVWIFVINIFHGFFENLFDLNIYYINAMLLYILCLPAVSMYQAKEAYNFNYKKNALISLFLSVGTVFLSLILVITLQNKLNGRIIGAVLPTVILGVVFYFYF